MNYKTTKIKGKSIRVHRIIAERELGRPLLKNEVVHHKNGMIQDNRPENLEVMDYHKHNQHFKKRIKVSCGRCGKLIKMREKQYIWKKEHHKNIYCSNICSGLDQLPKDIDKLILSEAKKGKTLYRISKENNLNTTTTYSHGKKLNIKLRREISLSG